MLTNLELILIVAALIMLFQYLTIVYVFLGKEMAGNTAIKTISNMQDYNSELFQKLLKEERLTLCLSNKIIELNNQKGTVDSRVTKLEGIQ